MKRSGEYRYIWRTSAIAITVPILMTIVLDFLPELKTVTLQSLHPLFILRILQQQLGIIRKKLDEYFPLHLHIVPEGGISMRILLLAAFIIRNVPFHPTRFGGRHYPARFFYERTKTM